MNPRETKVPMTRDRLQVSDPGPREATPVSPLRSAAPRRRTCPTSMKSDFRPPRENRFVIRAMQWLNPLIARFWRRILAMEMPEDELARLRALEDSRYLLCSNHPTLGDPLILMELSRRLGVTFNYMAAR